MRRGWIGLVAGLLMGVGSVSGWASESPRGTDAGRMNVIVILLDTVRPDHLSCYGYRRQTTPHIDEVARAGVVFTHAFSQAPQTFPSLLSLFTSQYPVPQWLLWKAGELDPSTDTLTELLKREGYVTAAFVGFPKDPSPLTGLVESRPFRAFDEMTFDVHLRALPQKLFDWLQTPREQPFFLFLHGFDAHEPHVLPIQYDAKRFNPRYRGKVPSSLWELLRQLPLSPDELMQLPFPERFRVIRRYYLDLFRSAHGIPPDDLKHLQAAYDAQLYYLDRGLGELWTALTNLHLMDRTIVVLLSDHGQAFGEHGLYADHGQCYDELMHIILIVADPRLQRRGLRIRHIVQAVDVMPTLLELLGVSPSRTAVGRSLAPLLSGGRDVGREEIAVSTWRGVRAIRTREWKLIAMADGSAELYHLVNDPREQHNVIHRYPLVATQLQQRLAEFFPPREAAHPATVEPGIRRDGYW